MAKVEKEIEDSLKSIKGQLEIWLSVRISVIASLDLATAGFKVYLVEKEPSIGGHMAQLDKTFPTNDCSM
jgi:heterodisulfide reductase subunit A-like polyferredoxin